MRFHKQYCFTCKKDTLFLEKLINPSDPNCDEIENKCEKCKSKYTKQKIRKQNSI